MRRNETFLKKKKWNRLTRNYNGKFATCDLQKYKRLEKLKNFTKQTFLSWSNITTRYAVHLVDFADLSWGINHYMNKKGHHINISYLSWLLPRECWYAICEKVIKYILWPYSEKSWTLFLDIQVDKTVKKDL